MSKKDNREDNRVQKWHPIKAVFAALRRVIHLRQHLIIRRCETAIKIEKGPDKLVILLMEMAKAYDSIGDTSEASRAYSKALGLLGDPRVKKETRDKFNISRTKSGRGANPSKHGDNSASPRNPVNNIKPAP